MNRFLRRAIFWGVLLLLAAGLIAYLARPHPVKVRLWAVERGRVEETVANTRAGTVKARARARLAPSIGGQVSRLAVSEGDRVEPSAVLFELWNEDLAAQVRLAESRARAARAQAEEACLLARQAEREAKRQRRLREDGLASEDVVDRVESEAEARKAACEAARAVTEEREASVDVARAALAKTVLRAPFAGIVAKLNVELGEYVTPSPPGIPTLPAVDLIDAASLYVEAPIDEVDAPRVEPGLPVRVTLDAFPGRTFPGRVRRVAPYVLDVEKQARTVDVEVDILEGEAGAGLLPGYSADVEVLIAARDDVLRVRAEAVLEGERVLVFEDGRLEERRVVTGLSNWDFVEVLEGLEEDDEIVLSLDREGIRPGVDAVPDREAVEPLGVP